MKMRKRAGFVTMTTALIITVFLFLLSAGITALAVQSLRTEEWMTERAQLSLHPIAWSTAYFVLDSISGDLSSDRTLDVDKHSAFVSNDSMTSTGGKIYDTPISFLVSLDKGSSVDVKIVLSSDTNYNAKVASGAPIYVTVTATDKKSGTESVVTGRIVSDDSMPKKISIDWGGN